MKNKIFGSILALMLAFAGFTPSTDAQVTTISGTMKVTVGTSFEFSFVEVHQLSSTETNPWAGTKFGLGPFNIDFGTLQAVRDAQNNVLFMEGQNWYSVMMIANTSGQPYHLTYQGAQTSIGLPNNSVLLLPDYSEADLLGTGTFQVAQGAMPSGAFLGTPASAFSSTTVYTSDTTGTSKIIRAYLTISGPPAGSSFPFNYSRGFTATGAGVGVKQDFTSWVPITPAQASGVYTGTFTFTLTP